MEDLSEKLSRTEKELKRLHEDTKDRLAEKELELQALSSRVFCVTNLQNDSNINFYTSFPNFLNPGENCESIRPRGTHFTDVPEDFYYSDCSNDDQDTDNTASAKRGPRRKIRPLDEFFIVMCRFSL